MKSLFLVLLMIFPVLAFSQRVQYFNAEKYDFGPNAKFTKKVTATSTTEGFHPCPSMTDAEMLAIATPQGGDCVHNTTIGTWLVYNATDLVWEEVGSGGISDWLAAEDYETGDVVVQGGNIYYANVDHTSSGSFATDIANWNLLGVASTSTSATDNSIARMDGTSGKVIQTSGATIDDSGNVSATSFSAPSAATTSSFSGLQINNSQITATGGSNLDLNASSGGINLKRNTTFYLRKLHVAYNDPTSGSNATLENHTTAYVRLTASGNLVSVDGIPAGNGGDTRTIVNLTGASVTFNNETGATAANRILTGTGSNLKVKNNGSIQVTYDLTQQRWYVTSGVSGSAGLGGTDTMFVQDFEGATSSDFATLTGWALNTSSPLHGDVDLKVAHATATTTYTVKQSVTVPPKFRGKNNTIKVTAKSSATAGNLVMDAGCTTDTDLLSSESLDFSSIAGGNEAFASFDIPESCTSLSYTIRALPETGPPTSTIDDLEIKLTEVEVMSALVQDYDSIVRLDTANGYGSTGTRVRRFSSSGLREHKGSNILYTDDSVYGSKFTVVNDSFCSVDYTCVNDVGGDLCSITKDMPTANLGSDPTANPQYVLSSDTNGNGTEGNPSWSGPLAAGSVIRPMTSNGNANSVRANRERFTISCAGVLKQATVNKNQKIKIPTSEVRFEGSSARGSAPQGAIVVYNTMTKLVGDAFDINPSGIATTYGTHIKMKKAGKLDVSASLLISGRVAISKNQTDLNSSSVPASEAMCTDYGTGEIGSASCSFNVAVNDVIRVSSEGTPSAHASNVLTLYFQEQDVQVGVSNTLPQYSDADSYIDITSSPTGNGSTYTKGIYFGGSPTVTQSGSAITINNSAANGTEFYINEDGIYDINLRGAFNGTGSYMGITRNTTSVQGSDHVYNLPSSQALAIEYATVSTAIYTTSAPGVRLSKGDVIRAQFGGSPTSYYTSGVGWRFQIAKIGKPNVTGVDVTPFIQVPISNQTATVAFTPTGTWTSNAAYSGFWWRDGEYMNARVQITLSGAPNAAALSLTIPGGYQIDTTKIFTTAYRDNVGQAYFLDTGVQAYDGAVQYGTSTSVNVSYKPVGAAMVNFGAATATLPFSFGSGDQVWVTFKVPILGWDATSNSIVTPVESFSSDTATLVHKTSAVTSADPVGTFSTYSFAASTNTKTICATAPTQTTADMMANGILMTSRPFSSASTCASPARIEIQIGKGFRGWDTQVFKSSGKTGTTTDGAPYTLPTASYNFTIRAYDPTTGILTLDSGVNFASAAPLSGFQYSDWSGVSTGYVVINGSKTPTLSGISYVAPRVAWLSDQKTSGTNGQALTGATWNTRTLTTETDASDLLTLSGNVFTLQPGTYYVEGYVPGYLVNAHKGRIRNTSAGTTVVQCTSQQAGSATSGAVTYSHCLGEFTITTAQNFEVQHYAQTTNSTSGGGLNAGSGEVEQYTSLKITKVK